MDDSSPKVIYRINNGEPRGASMFIPKNSYLLTFLVEPTRVMVIDLIKCQVKEIKQHPKSIDYKLQISKTDQVTVSFKNISEATEFENCLFNDQEKDQLNGLCSIFPSAKTSCAVIKTLPTNKKPAALTTSGGKPADDEQNSGSTGKKATVGETIDNHLKTGFDQLSKFIDFHSPCPIVKIFQALESLSSKPPESCVQASLKYKSLFQMTDSSIPEIAAGLQPSEYATIRDIIRKKIHQLYFEFNTRFTEQKLVSHDRLQLLLSHIIRTKLTLMVNLGNFTSYKAYSLGCLIQSWMCSFMKMGVQVIGLGIGSLEMMRIWKKRTKWEGLLFLLSDTVPKPLAKKKNRFYENAILDALPDSVPVGIQLFHSDLGYLLRQSSQPPKALLANVFNSIQSYFSRQTSVWKMYSGPKLWPSEEMAYKIDCIQRRINGCPCLSDQRRIFLHEFPLEEYCENSSFKIENYYCYLFNDSLVIALMEKKELVFHKMLHFSHQSFMAISNEEQFSRKEEGPKKDKDPTLKNSRNLKARSYEGLPGKPKASSPTAADESKLKITIDRSKSTDSSLLGKSSDNKKLTRSSDSRDSPARPRNQSSSSSPISSPREKLSVDEHGDLLAPISEEKTFRKKPSRDILITEERKDSEKGHKRTTRDTDEGLRKKHSKDEADQTRKKGSKDESNPAEESGSPSKRRATSRDEDRNEKNEEHGTPSKRKLFKNEDTQAESDASSKKRNHKNEDPVTDKTEDPHGTSKRNPEDSHGSKKKHGNADGKDVGNTGDDSHGSSSKKKHGTGNAADTKDTGTAEDAHGSSSKKKHGTGNAADTGNADDAHGSKKKHGNADGKDGGNTADDSHGSSSKKKHGSADGTEEPTSGASSKKRHKTDESLKESSDRIPDDSLLIISKPRRVSHNDTGEKKLHQKLASSGTLDNRAKSPERPRASLIAKSDGGEGSPSKLKRVNSQITPKFEIPKINTKGLVVRTKTKPEEHVQPLSSRLHSREILSVELLNLEPESTSISFLLRVPNATEITVLLKQHVTSPSILSPETSEHPNFRYTGSYFCEPFGDRSTPPTLHLQAIPPILSFGEEAPIPELQRSFLGFSPSFGPIAIILEKKQYPFSLRTANFICAKGVFPTLIPPEKTLEEMLSLQMNLHQVPGIVNFKEVTTSQLLPAVQAELQLLVQSNFKFGVVHSPKSGLCTENDLYRTDEIDADFEEFLNCMGSLSNEYTPPLTYRGGVDGDFYWTKFSDCSIAYHVGPLITDNSERNAETENSSKSDATHLRKVHIGNDVSLIIFQNSNQVIDLSSFVSKFNQLFIIVKKIVKNNETFYAVTSVAKSGIECFAPHLLPGQNLLTPRNIKRFILTKLINTERFGLDKTTSFQSKSKLRWNALVKICQQFEVESFQCSAFD